MTNVAFSNLILHPSLYALNRIEVAMVRGKAKYFVAIATDEVVHLEPRLFLGLVPRQLPKCFSQHFAIRPLRDWDTFGFKPVSEPILAPIVTGRIIFVLAAMVARIIEHLK